MARGLIDWGVRTLMLVLAGLVTLSILGSIAAMSSRSGGQGPELGRVAAPPPQPDARPPQDPEAALDRGETGGARVQSAPSAAVPVPLMDRSEKWLEAIAWTLLALAGLAGLAVILLWQAVRQLRRIADAREP